jgi:hypothetical protein
VNKIGKLKALFRDVTQADFDSRLFVVFRLVRKGKIIHDTKAAMAGNKTATLKKDKGVEFRR